jgi:hypothetical protein
MWWTHYMEEDDWIGDDQMTLPDEEDSMGVGPFYAIDADIGMSKSGMFTLRELYRNGDVSLVFTLMTSVPPEHIVAVYHPLGKTHAEAFVEKHRDDIKLFLEKPVRDS